MFVPVRKLDGTHATVAVAVAVMVMGMVMVMVAVVVAVMVMAMSTQRMYTLHPPRISLCFRGDNRLARLNNGCLLM